LADATPGEDLWRYDYKVSGRSFVQSGFFDIYFDPDLFASLLAGPPPNADWDVTILQQPAPGNLPPFDTGIFDAFALTSDPSLVGTFSVSFAYRGTGSPGAQPFEIFDDLSNSVETGFTTLIPEPSTAALSLIGLAGALIRFRRRA
jgi:hypothetical protein